jgi:hypothetical protein
MARPLLQVEVGAIANPEKSPVLKKASGFASGVAMSTDQACVGCRSGIDLGGGSLNGTGVDTGPRQFSRFYRSINWDRVFDINGTFPSAKVRRGYIDRPRRDR